MERHVCFKTLQNSQKQKSIEEERERKEEGSEEIKEIGKT